MKKITPLAYAVAGATALLLLAVTGYGKATSDQKYVNYCANDPCAIILF